MGMVLFLLVEQGRRTAFETGNNTSLTVIHIHPPGRVSGNEGGEYGYESAWISNFSVRSFLETRSGGGAYA